MKPAEDETESKKLSEIIENVSEDVTNSNDAVTESEDTNKHIENNFTLYFDINKFTLFADVPENEEVLETYLSNLKNTNKENGDLKKNCSNEIKESEEKYLDSQNLYASIKVYKTKPKKAVLSKKGIDHSLIQGVLNTNCTDQYQIKNHCNHNVSDSDSLLPLDSSSSNQLNDIPGFTGESKMSVISRNLTLSAPKRSIASSLKELSLNMKPNSFSTVASNYSLLNLGSNILKNQPSESSISTQTNTLSSKAKESGISNAKGVFEKKFKVESLPSKGNSGPNDRLFGNKSIKKTKGAHSMNTKVEERNRESSNKDIKRMNTKTVKRANAKLKYSGNEDAITRKELRVELKDFLSDGEEYQKLLNNKPRFSLQSIVITDNSSYEFHSNNSGSKIIKREGKSFATETEKYKSKTKSPDKKTSKKEKESGLDKSFDDCKKIHESFLQKADSNEFNFSQNNNDKTNNHSQILNVNQRNIATKASDYSPIKDICKKRKSVKTNSSALKSDLESSSITHENVLDKTSSKQSNSIENKGLCQLMYGNKNSHIEGIVNKNGQKKNLELNFLCNTNASMSISKVPKQNNLERSSSLDKSSSTSVNCAPKQSPFMQLFSKFAESESKHSEVKKFSVQKDFINFLSGSCKMTPKNSQIEKPFNEKSSSFGRILKRKVYPQLSSSEDEIGSPNLKTPYEKKVLKTLASNKKLSSPDSIHIDSESSNLFNNKTSVLKKDQKILMEFQKDDCKPKKRRKKVNSFESEPVSNPLSDKKECDSGSLTTDNVKKETIVLKHLNTCDESDNADTVSPEVSTLKVKRNSSKNIAESKASESSVLISSSKLSGENDRFPPEIKLPQSANSPENIDCNLSFKTDNSNSLLSVRPSSDSINTSFGVNNPLNMENIVVGKIESKSVCDKPIVESGKNNSLFKSTPNKISKISALQTNCTELSTSSTGNRSISRKTQKLPLKPENDSTFILGKEKRDSFSPKNSKSYENVLEGGTSSVTDVDTLETEPVLSDLSEAHVNTSSPFIKTPSGKKRRPIAKSKVSKPSALQSPKSQISSKNDQPSKTKSKLKKKPRKNSEKVTSSLLSRGKKKEMKQINSTTVASSPFVDILDNSLYMTHVDGNEAESFQPNQSSDNFHNMPSTDPVKVKKKKKLDKVITKSPILEHSNSLISLGISSDNKKYVKNKITFSKSSLHSVVDTSESQRDIPIQNAMEQTPRKSARLKNKTERLLSHLSISSDAGKSLKSGSSNLARKLAKTCPNPENNVNNNNNLNSDLNPATTSASSSISHHILQRRLSQFSIPSDAGKSLNSGSFNSTQKLAKTQPNQENYVINNSNLNPSLTSIPFSIPHQNPSPNSILPKCDSVHINSQVYYYPATQSLVIQLQCPQILNQSIISNVNPLNSFQEPQMPFQTQNLSTIITPLNTSAIPQNTMNPLFHANSIPQPSNFPCNNSFSTVNQLCRVRAISDKVSFTANLPGNQIFSPKTFSASQKELNVPNVAHINAQTPNSHPSVRTVNCETIIGKDSQWTLNNKQYCPQNSVQSLVNRHQNQSIVSSNASDYLNQNCKSGDQTQKVKSRSVSSQSKQKVELSSGNIQSSITKDIINGMIVWDNVIHNLTGFTCLQRMSEFTGIVFSAYDFNEFVTVREYYSNADNLNVLHTLISESFSDLEVPGKMNYEFHELFLSTPMRQIVKDYVSFYVKHICHVTNLKELIEQVYKTFSLRDCMYLSLIAPKEEKMKICKKVLVEYFTFIAILKIYDEYKRRMPLK